MPGRLGGLSKPLQICAEQSLIDKRADPDNRLPLPWAPQAENITLGGVFLVAAGFLLQDVVLA